MTTRTGGLGTAAAAVLLLATAACGGGGRPSAADISATLQKGVSTEGGSKVKLTEQQADCAAKVFLASDMSDQALRAIADSKEDYDSNQADNRALAEIRPDLAKCATS